jgi:hypothetical protein
VLLDAHRILFPVLQQILAFRLRSASPRAVLLFIIYDSIFIRIIAAVINPQLEAFKMLIIKGAEGQKLDSSALLHVWRTDHGMCKKSRIRLTEVMQ